MRKKNFFWNLLAIMMVAMVSLTMVSCSDDDDEVVKESSPIVGTWTWEDDESEDYEIVTFRADGTGTWTEYDSYYDESDTEQFSYQYNPNTKKLVIHIEDEVEEITISIVGDIMYMDGYTYRRVK